MREVTVEVDLGASPDPEALIHLEAKDENGTAVSSVTVGDEFDIEVYVTDTRSTPEGIFAAFVDIWFDETLVSPRGAPIFDADYSLGTNYNFLPGLIDEAGGSSDDLNPFDVDEKLLFTIPMVADSPGTLTLRSDAADFVPPHEVTAYGLSQRILEQNISYGSLEIEVEDALDPYVLSSDICGTVTINLDPPVIYESGTPTGTSTVTISSESPCTPTIEFIDLEDDGGDLLPDDNDKAYTLTATSSGPQISQGSPAEYEVTSRQDTDAATDRLEIRVTPPVEHTSGGPPESPVSFSKILTIEDDDGCSHAIQGGQSGSTSISEGEEIQIWFTGCGSDIDIEWDLSTNAAAVYGDPDVQLFHDGTLLSNTGSTGSYTLLDSATEYLVLTTYGDDDTEYTGTVTFSTTIDSQTGPTHTVNVLDTVPCSYDVDAFPSSLDEGFADTLGTDIRLVIDATAADSATWGEDYTLERTDGTPETLTLSPIPSQPGFYWTDVIEANGVSEVLIDVIPIDDTVFDPGETVLGHMEAEQKQTRMWARSTAGATVTIEDRTIPTMGEAAIQIDAEPDLSIGCVACGTVVAADGVAVDLQSGSPIVSVVPGLLSFQGEGTHGTQPVVRGEFELQDTEWPDWIDIQVSVTHVDGSTVSGLSAQPTFRMDTSNYSAEAIAFAVPVELEDIPATDSYRFTLSGTGEGSEQWSAKMSHFVIDRWGTNDIAPGLTFPFLKQALVAKKYESDTTQPDGVAIIRGDNSVSWYEGTGPTYETPPETTTTLSESANNKRYILTDRFGNVDEIAKTQDSEDSYSWEPGQHIKRIDRNGKETLFVYDGSDRLKTIIDPLDRETSFDYDDSQQDLLTLTVTDFADRETTVAYDISGSDPTIDVVFPDPTVVDIEDPQTNYDSGPQPSTEFVFDTQNRIKTITRSAAGGAGSEDQTITFSYDSDVYGSSSRDFRGLSSIKRSNESTSWELEKYRQAEQLPDPESSPEGWVAADGVNPRVIDEFTNEVEVQDRRANTTSYVVDHRGRTTTMTDAHGQVFRFDRKLEFDAQGEYVSDKGEILKSTTPDPDDFTDRSDVDQSLQLNFDLSKQETSYTYDSLLNVTSQTLPNLGDTLDPNILSRTWGTYTNGQASSFENELGQSADYAPDANGNRTKNEKEYPGISPNHGPHGATWQTPLSNLDVDRSGTFDQASDASALIDDVNSTGFGELDSDRAAGLPLVDTNGDGFVSSLDLITIVNNGTSSANGDYVEPVDQPVTYDYTDATDGLPLGLVKTKTVTTGRTSGDLVTEYEFYDGTDGGSQEIEEARYGLLKQVTFAVGSATLEVSVQYEYDENGNLRKYTDELDRVTEYLYDNLNRLAKVITPDPDDGGSEQPLVTQYYYDAFSNVARVEVRNYNPVNSTETHHTTCYYYDDVNRLQWQVNPHPTTDTTFVSDVPQTGDLGCDVSSTPANWTAAQSVTEWDGRPITHFSGYDGNDNLLSNVDALGRTTTYAYDDLNRLTKIVEPAPDTSGADASLVSVAGEVLESGGPVTTFVYDNLGNLWSTTDSLGHTTDFRYDAWNRQVEILEPEPIPGAGRPTTTFDYADLGSGWVHRVTDPQGRASEVQYDFAGRVIYTAQPTVDGETPVTWFQYHTDNLVDVVIDPELNETEYGYDDKARLVTVTQAKVLNSESGMLEHPITTFTYDDANQRTFVEDALGRSTEFTYDKMGRVTFVEPPEPDGAGSAPTMEYEYDAVGNLLRTTDALDLEMTYDYDRLFRRTKITDDENGVTQFGFDLANNLISLTDPLDYTTTWDYDVLDRVFRETNESADDRTYLYDAVGNLRSLTDRNERVTTYDYDDLYRVTEEQWNTTPARTFDFTYDLVGNMLSASDSDGTVDFVFSHDNLDRVVVESQEFSGVHDRVVFTHDYDLVNNHLSLAANLGGSVVGGIVAGGLNDFLSSYQYDDGYRVTAITQTQNRGYAVADKHVTFGYDVANQLTDVHRYTDLAASQLVAHSLMKYDDVGRVTDITHSESELTANWDGTNYSTSLDQIAAYSFEYDEGNQLVTFASWRDGFFVDYEYDERDQLTNASYYHGDETNYPAPFLPDEEALDFDANGNRESDTIGDYTTAVDNRLESDGVNDYEHDAEGNRTEITYASDWYREYEWDHRNRLVAATLYDDSDLQQERVDYEYDLFNRRIEKRTDLNGDGEVERTTNWVYSGGHISLEFSDTDGAGPVAPRVTHRYLHGPMIDMVLADEQVSEINEAGDVYWPLGDHLGSIRDVVDSNGDVQNHVIYDAYGNRLDEGTSTYENVDFLFGFTGRDWDADVDLQYNRARWYDPSVGRWLSEDPIGFNAGDANLYRYVGNEVTGAIDPSGRFEIQWNDQFSAAERQNILDSLDRILENLERLIGDVEAERRRLRGRQAFLLNDELNALLEVLNGVQKDILSGSKNLEFHRENRPDRDRMASAWDNVNFPWHDDQITWNDAHEWSQMTDAQLDELLFHELTHLHDTYDDDRSGHLMNAHTIDSMINGTFSGSAIWGWLRQHPEQAMQSHVEVDPQEVEKVRRILSALEWLGS